MSIDLPSRYVPTGDALSGGMGEVLICRDTNLDRLVAIKFIQDIEDMRRVRDEISALQSIRSKHVVEIFDLVDGDGENNIGIVQDYLPGADLFSLAERELSSEEYLKFLYQIAAGISDIHDQGVVHRDIKPNNMKFDQEGLVKIFDFGLAREVGPDAETMGFRGTHGFAAPELYDEGTVQFTEAVDTYAFGATAWYLAEDSLSQDMRQTPPVRTHETPRFNSISIDIPDEVADLLDLTLSEDPDDRPYMASIRDAISRHLLHGKHRGLIVLGTDIHLFDSVGKKINIRAEDFGSIQIGYDGMYFKIVDVSGDVYINNRPGTTNEILPGSCVIAIGEPSLGLRRKFVTFDISHPEVVL